MFKGLTKLVLLAGFAYWATGAAVFVHEQMEAGEESAAAVRSSSQHTLPGSTDRPAHDHDNCPVCQLLAHMAVMGGAACPMVSALMPAVDDSPRFTAQIPLRTVSVTAPIRGPPPVES